MSQNEIKLSDIQSFDGKYPKQLWYLFGVEMWERFCFYGMRGILTIFMVDQLFLSEKSSNLKYGAIQAFVYAFTFIGGIFADRILGFKKSLVFGALFMIFGNFLIAVDPHTWFYIGIASTVIGTGFFKPNISSMVGELYKENDSRRDAGFGMFYSGINIGALLGGIVCVYLGKYHSWNLAFLAAGCVMVIGLIMFHFTKKHLGPIGDSPLLNQSVKVKRKKEWMVYGIAILCIPLIYVMIMNTQYTNLFMFIVGPIALIYFLYALVKETSGGIKNKLIAAFILTMFSVVFFAIYEQAGGSLALFAKNNVSSSLSAITIDPNIVNNSANSLFIIVLSPLLGLFWLFSAKRKAEPNTVIKFGVGFFFLALAFYIFYSSRFFIDAEGKTSLLIFIVAYLIITIGELCVSPIGLSMVTKLSPKNLVGMMMGLWFLASAYGQYGAGLFGASMADLKEDASNAEKLMAYTDGYYQLAIYALVAGILIVALSPWIKKLMGNVK